MSAAIVHGNTDYRGLSAALIQRPETVLEAALRLAEAGLPVFPCRKDKRPACPHGFKDATCDPAAIAALWRDFPAPLIGVPTGEASGLDILDIDPRHGGDQWETQHHDRIPITQVHETQSGGRHYEFIHAPGMRNSAGLIAPGVDVRGDGGYAIWPPSPGYTAIIGTEPAPWPDWLLPLATKAVEPAARPVPAAPPKPISSLRLEAYVQRLLSNVQRAPEGAKHDVLRDTAIALGGVIEQAGISDDDAIALLLAALPPTVADWKLAAKTAQWGLTKGREAPIVLEDRPRPGNGIHGRPEPPPLDREDDYGGVSWDDEPQPDQATQDDAPLVLRPGAPLVSARAFIRLHHTQAGRRTLHHQNDTFYTWRQTYYAEAPKEAVRGWLYSFLDKARNWLRVSMGSAGTAMMGKK